MDATRRDTFTSAFTLDVVPERDLVRVSPIGEVDLATVATIRARIDELVSAGFTRVALDLRQVTFLDSSGLHLILELAACGRADGWTFAVVEGSPDVQRVFELAGVRAAVPFVDATGRDDGQRVPRWR